VNPPQPHEKPAADDPEGEGSSSEPGAYARIQRLLKNSRIPLEPLQAITDYVAAVQRLRGVRLAEAVDFYLLRRRTLHTQTVPELVERYLRQPLATAETERPTKRAASQLRAFAQRFTGPLCLLDGNDVQMWFDDLGETHTPRAQKEYLGTLGAFFLWARTWRYWAGNEPLPTALVHLGQEPPRGRDELLTPADLQTLFIAGARRAREGVPGPLLLLLLASQAGLRHREVATLQAEHLDLAGARALLPERQVPLPATLRAWLALVPHPRQGPLIIETSAHALDRELGGMIHQIGLAWPRLALRHSWLSYRLAQVEPAVLAAEAGISREEAGRFPRGLVTEAEAAAWFGILPEWCQMEG
jgi:hypothetical protein